MRAARISAKAMLVGALLASAGTTHAQEEFSIPTKPVSVDETYLTGLEWRNIGPKRGGRSSAAAGSKARPNEYYFGALGGGLWKTEDGGTTWKPVTDGKIDNSVIGGVAVCEANPDIVYISTGETELRGNIMPGNGLYKSTDAGKNWTSIGLKEVRNFSRIRVDPRNCDTAFAGGFGDYGTPGEARGVYKTSDGGKSWKKVLYRDPNSGAVDISIDARNPDILYAALWEAWRKPWGLSSGGPGSGLFKSVDGGEHWTELTRNPGMPAGLVGKIGVSVSPVDGRRVYAIVENENGGVFVSDDSGATWTRTNDSRDLRQRAFYYSRITADTKDKDRVYVTNVRFFRSDDGGKTFPTKIKVPHGDNHDLWIAPDNNQRMIEANDGGANVSVNGGKSWTGQAYPTAQIYRLTISNHDPYLVCGSQQDNSSICVPSRSWDHVNVLGGQYGFSPAGGESGYIANDPLDPDIFYAGSYGGLLQRYDHKSGQVRAINVRPDNPMGHSASDIGERFQWTFPIVFDPQDKQALYATSQHVWRTRNGGQSWDRISPDLTRHDPATLGPSGGPITRDQTGVETYATIFALAPSRLEQDVIWAGSDDGLVHVTRDNGATWRDVTPAAGVPKFLKITTIEDSPSRPGTAFLAGHAVLLGDMKPYLLKTLDYGAHWTAITNGIPADEPVRSVREDPRRPGLLFAGTERGVWVSFDDGQSWQKLQRNLPVTQVSDLAVTAHDLVIATHGRSFWVLDKIDVIRQLDTSGRGARAVQLFRPAPTVSGIDPGVTVDYFLPRVPRSLTLDILDADGRLIRSFAGRYKSEKQEEIEKKAKEDGTLKPELPKPGMRAGLNRFTWDMTYPGFTEFENMILWAAANRGPTALPGTYKVRLSVDGKALVQPAEIRLDPRVRVDPADLKKRFDFVSAIRAEVSRANDSVLLIRGIRAQLDSPLKKTGDPAIVAAVTALRAKLAAIEGELYQVRNRSEQDPLNYPIKLNNRLAALGALVDEGNAAPTTQDYAVHDELARQLHDQLTALDTLLATDLPALNAMLRAARLPPVERRPAKSVEPGTADLDSEAAGD